MACPPRSRRCANHSSGWLSRKAFVWYYREAAQSEGPPEATEVIEAVIENRLPIKLFMRADYSDAVGTRGRPTSE